MDKYEMINFNLYAQSFSRVIPRVEHVLNLSNFKISNKNFQMILMRSEKIQSMNFFNCNIDFNCSFKGVDICQNLRSLAIKNYINENSMILGITESVLDTLLEMISK